MINISASLIKKLRDRTNIGILECKKALIHANGNIHLAIDHLKKNGLLESLKKSERITQEGIVIPQITENKKNGVIVELNCETDFTSKNNKFQKFAHHVAITALKQQIFNIQILQDTFQKEKSMLISIFNENISIRRISCIREQPIIGSYLHNNKKIGVIVSVSGINLHQKQLIKHIAMHIAASKPEYIDIHHIPTNIIDHEKNIQTNIAMKSGKSNEIAKKIAEGRIKKFVNEISLVNQPFIWDTKKTVSDLLHENNIKINKFIRFEVGETIN